MKMPSYFLIGCHPMWKQSKRNETSVCPPGSSVSVKMSDTNTAAVQEKQKKVKSEAKSKVLDEETYWLLM